MGFAVKKLHQVPVRDNAMRPIDELIATPDTED